MRRSELKTIKIIIGIITHIIISIIAALYFFEGEYVVEGIFVIAFIGAEIIVIPDCIVAAIIGGIIEANLKANGKEIIEDCYEDNRSWEVKNLERKAALTTDATKREELYAKAKELEVLEKMSKK